MTPVQFKKWLREQWDFLQKVNRYGPPHDHPDPLYAHLQAAEILSEAAQQASYFGIGVEEPDFVTPKQALVIIGKLLSQELGEVLTPPQVARRLAVGPEKVLRWIRTGELHATNITAKPGGRPKYRIAPADLETFQKRRTPQAQIKTKRMKRSSGKIYF